MKGKTPVSRNHHFVPQFYLKNFAEPQSNEGKLHVYDLQNRNSFKTRSRNIASKRDFNRFINENRDPNLVENLLGGTEGKIADGFQRIIDQKSISNTEDMFLILVLIARLYIAHPDLRERLAQFNTKITQREMSRAVSTPQIWESFVTSAISRGAQPVTVSYDKAKEIVESQLIVASNNREDFIENEIILWPKLVEILHHRKWTLIVSDPSIGHFATSDRPWTLHPSSSPAKTDSVEFPLKVAGTCLTFPISRYLAVEGRFEGGGGTVKCTREKLAAFNSFTLKTAYRQVYSEEDFLVSDCDGLIRRFAESQLWIDRVCKRPWGSISV